jgi:glycosyltransferase involved in cell wall biosynthesis
MNMIAERENNLVMAKVSIIVPTFNASAVIENCLSSISNQDYPDLELIVVDDASLDNTREKVAAYKTKLITNQKNYGAGHSRNLGARVATSELLIFVDSDIIIPAGGISIAVKTILEKPSCLAVGGVFSDNTSSFNFISDFKNLDLSYRADLCVEHVKYLSSFFLVIRKTTFLESGGFSAGFSAATVEDIEFGYRVTKGRNLMFINKDIRLLHLKKYNLWSMLKTDYNRIVNMIKIIRISKGRYKAGEHAPLPYFLNLLLPALLVLFLLSGIKFRTGSLTLFLAAAFIVNNLGFERFLLKKRGFIFSVKSILVLFIEYIVVEFSIFVAFFIPIKKIPLVKNE